MWAFGARALRDAVGPARVQGRRYFRHARGGLAPGHRLDGAPRVDARVGAASDSAVSRSGRQEAAARHRRSADRAGRSYRARKRDAGGVPALAPPQPLWRRAIPVVLSAIVAGVLASAATVYLRPSQAPLVVTRFPFTLGEGQSIIDRNSSPSGRHLAGRRADGLHGECAALPPVDVGARGSPDRRSSDTPAAS